MSALPPIQVFLDLRGQYHPGHQCNLLYRVVNVGDLPISGLEVDLFQSAKTGGIDLTSRYDDQTLNLQPGRAWRCAVPFTYTVPGQYHIGARFRTTRHGRVDTFGPSQEPVFTLPAAASSGVLLVEGSAIVRNVPEGTHVSVGKDAIVDFANDVDARTAARIVLGGEEAPEEHDLRIVELRSLPEANKVTVSLERFANWCGRTGVKKMRVMGFVDARGGGATSAVPGPGAARPKVREAALYRLRFASYRGGFVTAIARGTSGDFMQLAPNTHGGSAQLSTRDAFLPGDLLQLPLPGFHDDELFFNGTGIEQVLALVTSAPLVPPAPLIDPTGTKPAFLVREVVHRLLCSAATFPDLEYGFAEVEVVPANSP